MAEVAKPVVQAKASVYKGEYRILNKHASAIEKVDGIYYPKDADEIKELEYQVSQGRVTKE